MNSILGFLFPIRETARNIESLKAADILSKYQPQQHGICTSLSSFHDPIIRSCIYEIKFHNNGNGAVLLAYLLKRWLETHADHQAFIIPVPLSSARYRERGYNQVTRIARNACKEQDHVILLENVLKRVHNTPPQTTLNRTERTQNLKNAFRIRNAKAKNQISNSNIILLDDVYTTGATLRAAKKTIAECGPALITCIALAH